MKLRTIATVLVLAMLFSGLVATFSFAEETKAGQADETRILSDVRTAYPDAADDGRPISVGSATAHGNNQTRIVSTDTGVYVTVPLQDDESKGYSATSIGFWHLNDKGEVDWTQILTDDARFVAAGTTSNVMADKDGNIWVVCQWIDDSFSTLLTWMYDPVTGETHDFSDRKFVKFGANYGKANTIVDVDNGKLYSVVVGGEGMKSGYLGWFVFDIATRTWSEYHYKKVACCAYYHYGYADGKGGFVTICENVRTNYSAATNIEGMNVAQAIETFHSCHQNANYCWEAPYMIYVPDADVSEGYMWNLEPPVYDVENGMYPGDTNAYNDLYFDRDTGYLYSITTLWDNGTFGSVKHLHIMDTNHPNEDIEKDGVYPITVHKNIEFLYGFSETYAQHIYKDTQGNFYIVAVASRIGRVEIWKASDPLFTDLTLVCVEEFSGAVDVNSGGHTYGMISATSRNNSVEDDTAEMLLWNYNLNKWLFFTVDFEAVRAVEARRSGAAS